MIRKAAETDLEAIFELYYEFHEFHVRGVPGFLRSMGKPDDRRNTELVETLRKIIAGPDSALLVAEDGTGLVGLVEVYLKHKSEGNRLVIPRMASYVQSLIVREARRKEGWGKLLMDAAEAWAREHGAKFMELELWEFTGGPLAFYEKLGYRTVRRRMNKELGNG